MCIKHPRSHLPFAVLGLPLQRDAPVLRVGLGAVSDGQGQRDGEVEARGTVRHLRAQEDLTALQGLHTETQRDTQREDETHRKRNKLYFLNIYVCVNKPTFSNKSKKEKRVRVRGAEGRIWPPGRSLDNPDVV